MQVVLGQSFHAFADSNDGGRDGAFEGTWVSKAIDPAGTLAIPNAVLQGKPVVVQCKFSASGTGTLMPSNLKDEIKKVKRLHRKGLCDAYIVMTNLGVTGTTEEWIKAELKVIGVEHVLVLDGTWINQQISKDAQLRRYVPRVYGLGDLGQILDDRRLGQAKKILASLGEDIATFVPTRSYRDATDTLEGNGLVILLGAPAAGKSTIAAMLSAVALDQWGCSVQKVASPDELISAWNPNDDNQLFWVDDAFGAIRYDSQATEQWARRLAEITAIVKEGNKVVITSRDYIYQEARIHLKEYAHPILRSNNVVIDVEDLTPEERRQILYNHLKAGDQSALTLRRWRPYLNKVAQSATFQPELARRLGRSIFTTKVTQASGVLDFVNRPTEFLRDVLQQLDSHGRASLACIFLSKRGLPVSTFLSNEQKIAISHLGSSSAQVMSALKHLDGSFLAQVPDLEGNVFWQFRHPTIREGFSAVIAGDPNALNILVDGLSDEELVRQVDCGGSDRGYLVTLPAQLYEKVARRVDLHADAFAALFYNPSAEFLSRRSSDAFLRTWLREQAPDWSQLVDFENYLGLSWKPRLLARFATAGLLPEDVRLEAVGVLTRNAITQVDATWLHIDVRVLFTLDEQHDLKERFINEVLPILEEQVHEVAGGYPDGTSANDRYANQLEAIESYVDEFDSLADEYAELQSIIAIIEERMSDEFDEYEDYRSDGFKELDALSIDKVERDIFDDVDSGH